MFIQLAKAMEAIAAIYTYGLKVQMIPDDLRGGSANCWPTEYGKHYIAGLKRMVKDLNFPLEVKVLPTVREKNGLAMSSRNSYLSSAERDSAPVLYQALKLAQKSIRSGEKNSKKITEMMRTMIRAKTNGPIDYVECVDTETLSPLKELRGNILIALAVWFGKARLIDNILVRVP